MERMSNYAATVVKISNLRPHSNADRLICTNIFGNNVIVGKETKIGDVGLFFPLESQIGKEFAENNDLIRRKDEKGKPAGGMFDENRRVRAQTFRGEKSMGFWIPIDCLKFAGLEDYYRNFGDGMEIEKLNDLTISQKYIPRNANMPGSGKKKEGRKPRESRIIPDQFRFHFDTAQLGKNIHKLKVDDLIAITWKLHGTSAIAGNCLVKRPMSIFTKILDKLGVPVQFSTYDYIWASRRVVKNQFESDKQHFYTEDLWFRVGKELFEGKLHQGEQVYYEIVGYTQDGGMIQKDFDYHCEPGTCKAYIYRITQTGSDGTVFELSWLQVKQRSLELGVSHVPEIYYRPVKGFFGIDGQSDDWHYQLLAILQSQYVYDQDSQFCRNKVPEEGICVRIEGLSIDIFKLKSFRFLEYETKQLDTGVVDLETNESI